MDATICENAAAYRVGMDQKAEMVRRTSLFPGDLKFQQLLHIFSLLGTPTETQWPGIRSLRDWHTYPHWEPQKLQRDVPSLSPDGIDLLSKMLKYDPAERISAKAAMEYPYFNTLINLNSECALHNRE